MRTVPEQKDSNMTMKTVSTKVVIGDQKPITVSIPCATNTTKVKAGDELVLFKPAPAVSTPKAQPHAQVAIPAAKRPRTT